MAYELSGYQIALISVLALNFVFWILIIVCKSFLAENIANAFRRYISGLRDLFRPHNSSSISQAERSHESTLERRQSQIINHEPPPPYEEAVKYPSISSLLSSSTLENANYHAGICNDGLVRDSIVITINGGGIGSAGVVGDYSSQRVLDQADSSIFPEQISCPTTSQVTLSPPLPRSFSCNDLLNLPPLPFNEKAQFTISTSPFTKHEVALPAAAINSTSSSSSSNNNKNTNSKLKSSSKLPQEVNFTLKVSTNQPCTSTSTTRAANVTGISETICLREKHRSLSKNTSIIDDDDVPSSTMASTMAHVEACTSVVGNTIDRQ